MMQVGKEVSISERQCHPTFCLEMSSENANVCFLLRANEGTDKDMHKH